MVAVAVFGVIASVAASALGLSLNLSRNNRHRSVAANLAAAEMDALRAGNFEDIPIGSSSFIRTVGEMDYTVTRNIQWVPVDSTAGPCESPLLGTEPAVLRVSLKVTWALMSGAEPVRSQSVIAPPVGVYDPSKGHVGVKVVDRNGAPLEGHVVALDGPGGSRSLRTTEDGCAFFAYLAPGAYSVSLSTPGFVDPQGDPAPRQSVGVFQGRTTSVSFAYDRAASMTVDLQAPAGYAAPPDVGLSLANTGLAVGYLSVPTFGDPVTVENLYPYPSGYQVWAGQCADADPEGQRPDGGGPYHPEGARGPAVVTDPGATSSAVVGLQALEVLVVRGGAPVAGVGVLAVHAAPFGTDQRCPGGQSLNLGSTGVDGRLRAALPPGYWELQVSGSRPLRFWPVVMLSPGDAAPASATVELR